MKKQKSFTLIEILVVVAIIGLIASIVLVATKSARDKARIAKGLQFSASVHHALGAFAVGIWDFDEGSGDIAGDASGNGNDGTLTNGPIWRCASTDPDYTPSGKGCSLEFDGVDDYVDCGNDASLSITEGITIEAWVKSAAFTSKTMSIVNKSSSYYLYARAGWYDRPYFFLYFDGGTGKSLSGNQVPTDIWQHIVVTYKESDRTMRMFQNGVETKTKLLSGLTDYHMRMTTASVTISRSGGSLKGLIDDVRIYEEALSSSQIRKLYVEGARGKGLVIKIPNHNDQ